jgi:hypothetical protein
MAIDEAAIRLPIHLHDPGNLRFKFVVGPHMWRAIRLEQDAVPVFVEDRYPSDIVRSEVAEGVEASAPGRCRELDVLLVFDRPECLLIARHDSPSRVRGVACGHGAVPREMIDRSTATSTEHCCKSAQIQ